MVIVELSGVMGMPHTGTQGQPAGGLSGPQEIVAVEKVNQRAVYEEEGLSDPFNVLQVSLI